MSSPSPDDQTLEKIRQLLKDPVAGPKLMAIVNQPNTGMAANFGSVANAISKQTTPSGQLGAGIGGAAAMGLQALLKKKTPASQTGGPGGPDIPGVESSGRVGSDGMGNGDYSNDISNEDTPLGGFADGGEIDLPVERGALARRPAVSTTIVIAKKPEKKPEKKPVKRKAAAAPAPFAKGGHVQVPRGAGCAERGKQFRGIY